VDAWQFTDKFLNSALGRSDGRVYAELFRLALQSPLNSHDVTPAYTQHLAKLLNPHRSAL
jgi:acyl-CoA oxidase